MGIYKSALTLKDGDRHPPLLDSSGRLVVATANGAPLSISDLRSGTPTRTTVSSSTTSATILAANTSRKGAIICNSDANDLLLDLSGGTASASRFQVRLAQNQAYELPYPVYTGLITGIWVGDGSGLADVVEYT